MDDLDFYVEVLLSGRVSGVGPGASADQIEEALGRDYVDDVQPRRWMRRDYGLIEFFCNPSAGGWICFGLSVQVHRLSNDAHQVPQVILDRFGKFRSSVTLGQLVKQIEVGDNAPKVLLENHSAGSTTFKLEGTGVCITTSGTVGPSLADSTQVSEDVWSIEVRAVSRRPGSP